MKIILYSLSMIAGACLLVYILIERKKNGFAQKKEAARKTEEKKAAEQAFTNSVRSTCKALLDFYGYTYMPLIAKDVKADEMEIWCVVGKLRQEEPKWMDVVCELFCPHDKSLIGTYSWPIPQTVICKQGQVHTEADLLYCNKIVKVPAGDSVLDHLRRLECEESERKSL